MSIMVDAEFKALIPPLSPEEYAQLEENCVREGIRDPQISMKFEDEDMVGYDVPMTEEEFVDRLLADAV